MEVAREEEFAPVKNKDGPDSPDTARQALIDLHHTWLEKAGIAVPADAKVEISPLFALTPEEAAEKLRTRKVVPSPDIYIE
jgi:UDP-N-acetylglucosamine/UDP-N-acetylgalactosamine diphosphorylase